MLKIFAIILLCPLSLALNGVVLFGARENGDALIYSVVKNTTLTTKAERHKIVIEWHDENTKITGIAFDCSEYTFAQVSAPPGLEATDFDAFIEAEKALELSVGMKVYGFRSEHSVMSKENKVVFHMETNHIRHDEYDLPKSLLSY